MSAGHEGTMPALPAGLMAPGATAYDLSYGLAHAPFAAWAAEQGAETVHDGLGMLVEQAALSFQRWHDVVPDTAAVHAALRVAQG
jgi:shikimate dehydrogenase